jgi:hypothetical protein
MRKLIFNLAAPLPLSAVAVAADDAAPPVASGAMPSGYVGLARRIRPPRSLIDLSAELH